ncbi:MAG: DUF4382 domain-containing protein [Pseudomonadota bacterium]
MKTLFSACLSEMRRSSFIVLCVLLAIWLTGCGGGGDEQSSDETGEVYIGITDAPGDFHTYTVDVTSLALTKANGAVVETLPINTRIDFAEYVEMTEFFTAQSIPSGRYVQGEMSIDYSNADIWVEGESGNAVKVENLIDESGNPVLSLTLEVTLEDRNQLRIVPGVPASLTLDFDLNASHQTVFEDDVPTTTIEPVLIADVDFENDKQFRARGPLLSVDEEESSYQIVVRPFRHAHDANDRRFGQLNVTIDDDTVFDIDGSPFTGAVGLAELANMPQATATIALGELQRNPRVFLASEVYAGSSVPGGDLDVVRGHVIARSGDSLTVKGATLIRSDASAVFNDEVEVTIADSTIVTKQLSTDSFTVADVSVGQKISAFGTLTDTDPESLQLDASAGSVRLLLTRNSGVVVDDTDGELSVDLSQIGRRDPSEFDFSGTGIDVANDTDPESYEYETGALNTSAFGVDSSVKARGFVTAFGTAPKDFDVHTLIDVAALPSVLVTNWDPATATAFSAIDASGLTLDLTGAGRFHHISQGGVRIDLNDLSGPVTIAPSTDGGIFSIRSSNSRETHTDFTNFTNFTDSLQSWIDSGATVQRIVAPGSFDNDTNELTARRILIVLSDT